MNDIQKLRYWTFKILPLVYDDSLSYYEVLAKVTSKINELVQYNNDLNENIAQTVIDQVKAELDSDELATKVFDTLAGAIATDEGDTTYTPNNKTGGELVWINGTLYKVTKNMVTGELYTVGTNIETVKIADELALVKKYLTGTHNQYWNTQASESYDTGIYLFWKDTLYKTTKDIALNDILATDGNGANLEEVNIGTEITSHYFEMKEADENLQTQIDNNKNDVDSNLSTINTTLSTINTTLEQTSVYVTPEMYGAIGDGETDDTEALQTAINQGAKTVLLSKNYKITENITLPNTVSLIGNGMPTTTISGSGTIYVTGSANVNTTYIQNIIFSGVDLSLGYTTDDYANEITIKGCTFTHPDGYPLTLANNCWNILIMDCTFNSFYQAITCNFTNAVNAGANINLIATSAYNGTTGLAVNGVTADGGHINLIGCNLEHCHRSISADANSSGNVIICTNLHIELNTEYGLYTEGAIIVVNGGWIASTTLSNYLFSATNSGAIQISGCRIIGTFSKLYAGNISANNNIIGTGLNYNFGNYANMTSSYKKYATGTTSSANVQSFSGPFCYKVLFKIYVPGNNTSTSNIVITCSGGGAARTYSIEIPSAMQNTGGTIFGEFFDCAQGISYCKYYSDSYNVKYKAHNVTSVTGAFSINDTENNKTYALLIDNNFIPTIS